jgi:hypothetical protein
MYAENDYYSITPIQKDLHALEGVTGRQWLSAVICGNSNLTDEAFDEPGEILVVDMFEVSGNTQ